MDAIDDRFQHTLHVLTLITMGWLNLQELSINIFSFAYHFSIQFRLFSPSSDILPSRDAVDDRFQNTPNVLTGIMTGQVNSRAQGLLIDMLNYIEYGLIKIHLAL